MDDEDDDEVEEDVLRERGRRRWMRWDGVGQRGGEDMGGEEDGEEELMLLRRLLDRLGRRVLDGLGKPLRAE